MAEVINMTVDSLDSRRGGDRKDNNNNGRQLPVSDDPNSSPPAQPPPRRRDRDSRERRDRDFNDRNCSPPPPPPIERDYKRRSSISPPPPPLSYRGRRHSPPPRRSPPYKRSRREDGGYEGRRGSPRGGFGPGDRRFGYDHGGGYDREMMGRPGYLDDRPHGRFGRSSGGYQDWDSGSGRYGDASYSGSAQSKIFREGLMTYKQFIQELEDDILPAEAERRYQEYKSEYISTQKQAFFDAHKDEEWLRDKYHPTNLVTVIERRNELARKVAKDFLLDLQSGTLDLTPGVNAFSSNKSGQTSEPNSEDETDTGGKRKRHGREPTKETGLSLAPKAHPISSDPRRIQIDIGQAQYLVRKLDSEKGIEENILTGPDNDKINRDKSHGSLEGQVIIVRGLTSVKGLEGVELLDTLITYLWRVHGVDYYGMVETSEAKGLRHVRAEGKNSDVTSNGSEWEMKLDSHWQGRLSGQDPLEVTTAKDKIDVAAVEALDPFVRKIRDEKYGWKYGCGAKGCTKLFHAAEFVHKHLKLKHPELVFEQTSNVREELYFQNYMNDPDAPGGKPVLQQPLLKNKPQRRQLMENRLKDERGSHRERDNRASGSDRFDRSENPQSSDFPSNNDGPDGGSNDDPMFDAFGRQGMHVAAPFSSDMAPPPVLMPVPGAGPLGPFVPAPPELAMQVFRERGGNGPFEGNARSGCAGPNLTGPVPFLLPPGFRKDPRHLRSYQDLDAPDDEVTVIDYRSL
ncbi:serrate RNA effector molecule-like isoform X1 [Hibiscus syriacus]|uniref:serrate RNA effector molecule-like isoform X1 n=1 Tax=Hibiscus syriacus TaxID=106335 RepID=UPI001920E801|nr:serrate RNA effector molecule-like isoform X1 [Hibiscus syriacus]